MKRSKMKNSKSRKLFTKTASMTHKKNLEKPTLANPMRGGIRL